MATASSAQREPSMEEILASIRRIIEDSDGGRKQDVAAGGPGAEVSDGDASGAAPEVEVFRAELRAAEPEPGKPVSLAEVQAQLASEQPAASAPRAADPDDAVVERPATLAEVGARVASGETAADPAAAAGRWQDTAAMPEAAGHAGAPHADEPRIEIDDDDLVIEDETPFEPDAQAAMQRPALVSEETGRQVAAAFGELSQAFASRSKKSFDEMAEEMLRPMLQDWLDNNLPTLVERLVREEIERVARGGA
jgi:cell pole-organizing protein PopZ